MRLPWLDPQRRRSVACAAVVLSLAGWVLAHRPPPPEAPPAVAMGAGRAIVRFEGRGAYGRLAATPPRIASGARWPVSLELRVRAADGTALSDVDLALHLPPRARVLGVWGMSGADPSRLRLGSVANGEERTGVVELEIAPSTRGDVIDVCATLSLRQTDGGREEITLAPLRIDVAPLDAERFEKR